MTTNTIVKADIEYSDGTKATFTGDPLDLSILQTQSPEQQDAENLATDTERHEADESTPEVPAEAKPGDEIPDRNVT
jgi:hypothetical protein